MMSFYIHKTACISPQQTFGDNIDIETLQPSVDNKLYAIEPAYPQFKGNALRRMSKSTRIGAGAALPLLAGAPQPDGIIIGTQVSGMEENGKFLNQIIEYNEDMLTPGSFVQGTPNTISSQIALISNNKNYNLTHVHRGLAFENAVIDVAMLLNENPGSTYLLGGVDEISVNNYTLDTLAGWFKKEDCLNSDLYQSTTDGSLSGEGAAMFMVGNDKQNAIAQLKAITTIHSAEVEIVAAGIKKFLEKKLTEGEKVDLLLSGENGDQRSLPFYTACNDLFDNYATIARFKHLCGEYPTASSFALWLACNVVSGAVNVPQHMVKQQGTATTFKNILIYNTHKVGQHSCMLVTVPA
jgi:3-oxoacyl-[acyl-carrier-protein] synthase II